MLARGLRLELGDDDDDGGRRVEDEGEKLNRVRSRWQKRATWQSNVSPGGVRGGREARTCRKRLRRNVEARLAAARTPCAASVYLQKGHSLYHIASSRRGGRTEKDVRRPAFVSREEVIRLSRTSLPASCLLRRTSATPVPLASLSGVAGVGKVL